MKMHLALDAIAKHCCVTSLALLDEASQVDEEQAALDILQYKFRVNLCPAADRLWAESDNWFRLHVKVHYIARGVYRSLRSLQTSG